MGWARTEISRATMASCHPRISNMACGTSLLDGRFPVQKTKSKYIHPQLHILYHCIGKQICTSCSMYCIFSDGSINYYFSKDCVGLKA